MLKKSKKTLAIMCCLMLTFTSVAFADASKGEGVSKEAVSEKNTYSFNISVFSKKPKFQNSHRKLLLVYGKHDFTFMVAFTIVFEIPRYLRNFPFLY